MSVLKAISNFLGSTAGGNAAKFAVKVADKIMKQFPDKLSENERAQIEMMITSADHQRTMDLLQVAQNQDEQFNNRIRDLEGTAKDLMQFGLVGRFIIFLRGAQRPMWGYGTLYLNYQVFSGNWEIPMQMINGQTQYVGMNQLTAFVFINILVLTFLFGERAFKNAAPFIKSLMSKR